MYRHPHRSAISRVRRDDEMIAAIPGKTRAWLDTAIERITVAPAMSLGARFDQSRVTITWC